MQVAKCHVPQGGEGRGKLAQATGFIALMPGTLGQEQGGRGEGAVTSKDREQFITVRSNCRGKGSQVRSGASWEGEGNSSSGQTVGSMALNPATIYYFMIIQHGIPHVP